MSIQETKPRPWESLATFYSQFCSTALWGHHPLLSAGRLPHLGHQPAVPIICWCLQGIAPRDKQAALQPYTESHHSSRGTDTILQKRKLSTREFKQLHRWQSQDLNPGLSVLKHSLKDMLHSLCLWIPSPVSQNLTLTLVVCFWWHLTRRSQQQENGGAATSGDGTHGVLLCPAGACAATGCPSSKALGTTCPPLSFSLRISRVSSHALSLYFSCPCLHNHSVIRLSLGSAPLSRLLCSTGPAGTHFVRRITCRLTGS